MDTNDCLNPQCMICAECKYLLLTPVYDHGFLMKGVHPCAKDERLHAVNERACYMAESKQKD